MRKEVAAGRGAAAAAARRRGALPNAAWQTHVFFTCVVYLSSSVHGRRSEWKFAHSAMHTPGREVFDLGTTGTCVVEIRRGLRLVDISRTSSGT